MPRHSLRHAIRAMPLSRLSAMPLRRYYAAVDAMMMSRAASPASPLRRTHDAAACARATLAIIDDYYA